MTGKNVFYQDESRTYYANARREILPLQPKGVDRVLEIGSADGSRSSFANIPTPGVFYKIFECKFLVKAVAR